MIISRLVNTISNLIVHIFGNQECKLMRIPGKFSVEKLNGRMIQHCSGGVGGGGGGSSHFLTL